MSTAPQDNGRRKVVVAPTSIGQGSLTLLKIIPVWVGSAVIHGALLVLAYFLFLLISRDNAAQADPGEVVTETIVEEPVKEDLDLTNTDIGIDDKVQTNYFVDRIEDVSVPGPVDPTAPVGIVNAPEDAVRSNVPLPPGTGGGTGAAPMMADAGVGSMTGTLGGMGGISLVGAFAGRSGATREKMLQEGGGNKMSEASVARGLEWFALHQAQDGRWSLHEFNRHAREKPYPAGGTRTCNCQASATNRNDIAATGFGLLPFLAGGQTHKVNKTAKVDYSKTVGAGLHYLINKQGKDGYYGGDMYAHGIATIAMCEAYGLTSDPMLKSSAQRALNYIFYAQDPAGGGWRYSARQAGDTSVTGWQLMAIKSGQMSGLSVPKEVLKKAERFLDSVESNVSGSGGAKGGGFGYTPGGGPTYTMTAVGLLCRQYMGTNPRNPALINGIQQFIRAHPPGATNNLYYEYYATQVMHHMGGDSWDFWNLGPAKDGKGGIRDTLIAKQDKGTTPKHPHQAGSWGGEAGGRVMASSLSLLCLEVYYRHLPLYRRDLGVMKEK
jgi:hypothetical protein